MWKKKKKRPIKERKEKEIKVSDRNKERMDIKLRG